MTESAVPYSMYAWATVRSPIAGVVPGDTETVVLAVVEPDPVAPVRASPHPEKRRTWMTLDVLDAESVAVIDWLVNAVLTLPTHVDPTTPAFDVEDAATSVMPPPTCVQEMPAGPEMVAVGVVVLLLSAVRLTMMTSPWLAVTVAATVVPEVFEVPV